MKSPQVRKRDLNEKESKQSIRARILGSHFKLSPKKLQVLLAQLSSQLRMHAMPKTTPTFSSLHTGLRRTCRVDLPIPRLRSHSTEGAVPSPINILTAIVAK